MSNFSSIVFSEKFRLGLVPLPRWLAGWRWFFTRCGSQAHHSIPHSAPPPYKSNSELTVFVRSSLVEPRCPCRDVGEVIPVGSLRPRVQNLGRPHLRTPIMRRLHADRGDNPDPGIGHQSTCSKKIVDERCAIRQRTQSLTRRGWVRGVTRQDCGRSVSIS